MSSVGSRVEQGLKMCFIIYIVSNSAEDVGCGYPEMFLQFPQLKNHSFVPQNRGVMVPLCVGRVCLDGDECVMVMNLSEGAPLCY